MALYLLDEIGMLSEIILEKVELVGRLARNSKLVFGGLQVIEIISSKKKSRYKTTNQLNLFKNDL
jgi:hypothetical protein